MATKPKALHLPVDFTSLRDMAHQQATYIDNGGNYAAYAVTQGVKSEKVTDEQKSEIYAGYMVRFNENNPVVSYLREGEDNYIPLGNNPAPEGREAILIGVDHVMAYTTHAFGQLKSERPNYYAIVNGTRDAFNKYASNTLRKLLIGIKAIETGVVDRTRSPNAAFEKFSHDVLEKLKTRNKNAASKGDMTAVPENVLKDAITAFHVVIAKHFIGK